MKNQSAKRITALLLSAAAITSTVMLAACNDDSGGKNNGPKEEALSYEYLETALPTDTYTGSQLGLLGREATGIEPKEEENGQPVDDALLRRNAKIEELYDVELKYYVTGDTTEATEKLNTAVLANETIYDLFFGNLGIAAPAGINNSLIMSTENIPYLDLSQSWWAADCTDQLSIHNKSFFISGKIAYEYTIDGTVLYFNKLLTDNKGLDNHFETVRNGAWTLDKMNENMKAVANDDNGDTIMTENDTWGLKLSHSYGHAFYTSAGVKVLEYDEEDEPYYVDDVTSVVTKLEALRSILSNRRYVVNVHDEGYSGCEGVFTAGKSLYEVAISTSGIDYRTQDFYDFGIIPLPKYDEAQPKYITWAYSYNGGMLMFPVTNRQEAMTGVITEAMAYLSSVENGYYYAILEKYIKGRGTYDLDSEEMLDLSLTTKAYDLAILFNWGLSSVLNESTHGVFLENSDISFATAYAGRARAASRAIRSTVKQWDSLD